MGPDVHGNNMAYLPQQQLVPAVTELIVAQLMYLEWMNSKEPVYIYINSTGTARDDGEPVGMESEGFAIYDAMMRMKTEVLCLTFTICSSVV
ncbi:ATP-dependent Clp protease proteolytic subunit [Zea mays]|uniref:ATP-dependent Clp protease proteolytic subunit n=1 Tax=Zea mays TaxID=4577 RepID=A0A1D6K2T1_MAIZE|nr:ATP-dependent Clp protease proteolytic subunit [Zea mays]